MPLQATSGAASYDAFGGGVAAVPNYIEDVFSTWLYTGNGSTQTINNGIDLAGKGGLVWAKTRDYISSHALFDTVRGGSSLLQSNSSNGAYTGSTYINPFNSNGFTWDFGDNQVNGAGRNYASWTFRKQPKFFDVVTYTGNNTVRTIAHNLGSEPGCIIVKNIENPSSWTVYHRSLGNTKHLNLNETASEFTSTSWNNTTPTSTTFTLGSLNNVNASGDDFVAYVFAHNAGGFGLNGTDNVISCGSFTTNAGGQATVDLGYEPQWLLVKNTAVTSSGTAVSWNMTDNMRGMPVGSVDPRLFANTSDSENTSTDWVSPTATGFVITPNTSSGDTFGNSPYIYIAIRRGPMKVPTTGTSVFSPNTASYQAIGTQITTNFPVDMTWWKNRDGGPNGQDQDRLRGFPSNNGDGAPTLYMDSTAAEGSNYTAYQFWNTGFRTANGSPDAPSVFWNFRRAPGFFDAVCYTGTGSATTITHNLQAVPELIICKQRNSANSWFVYASPLGASQGVALNGNFAAFATTGMFSLWNDTAPTSSVFSLGQNSSVNTSAATYVAYLFASCPGVSKVGSYTGNGTTQTINCGFTGGARFVLLKRTDASGGWYVYDTARGMTTLTDPYLFLNSTAAEVATLGSVTTVSTGFALNATILAAINTNAASYIFLAIS